MSSAVQQPGCNVPVQLSGKPIYSVVTCTNQGTILSGKPLAMQSTNQVMTAEQASNRTVGNTVAQPTTAYSIAAGSMCFFVL